jgi:predicted alpha/beta superfamily hydrolase
MHSNVLNEDRNIIVYLPTGYDSTTSYPVMYVLDGSAGDKHFADKFDVLSAVGYAPKTIVVSIPNLTDEGRQRNLTPPFMNTDALDSKSAMGSGNKFLAFMESELFPFIENNYPASQERLFTGHSRGGLLVMYSLMYNPGMFKARFCYSAPFWRQDNILVSKIDDFLNTRDTLDTFIYTSAGSNETENIRDGLVAITKVFERSAPAGLTWHANITPNATHQNNAGLSAATALGKWSLYLKQGNYH